VVHLDDRVLGGAVRPEFARDPNDVPHVIAVAARAHAFSDKRNLSHHD
jgi:hypothetical protein